MKRMLPILIAVLAGGCGADDPKDSGAGGGGVAGGAMEFGGVIGAEACAPKEGDYPGGWDSCVSDDGRWMLAGESAPSSAARVAAFERIADLLWRKGEAMTTDAFVQAQLIYSQDEGVGSRVSRRYDAHEDKPEGADCKAEDAGDRWPGYCVGAARMEPAILDAFEAGINGQDMAANASRIRSTLLWFYYVSSYKEAFSCAQKKKDCDSAWAYYTGGKQPDEDSLGLGGVVAALSPEVHEAVFDALLAVRCWRDLDSGDTSTDEGMHAKALDQLDRALNRAWFVAEVGDGVPSASEDCP